MQPYWNFSSSDLLFHSPRHWNWRWHTKVKSQYWQLLVSDTCQNVMRDPWKEIRCQKHITNWGFFFPLSYITIHKAQELYAYENKVAATCHHFLFGNENNLDWVSPKSPGWARSGRLHTLTHGNDLHRALESAKILLLLVGLAEVDCWSLSKSIPLTQHPMSALHAASPWGSPAQLICMRPSTHFKPKLPFPYKRTQWDSDTLTWNNRAAGEESKPFTESSLHAQTCI